MKSELVLLGRIKEKFEWYMRPVTQDNLGPITAAGEEKAARINFTTCWKPVMHIIPDFAKIFG